MELSCPAIALSTPLFQISWGGPPGLIAETLFSPRLVTVTVKTLTGRRFSLLYPATEDVADIRDEIRFREGIPNEQQRLVLNGRQLEDGRSLADHGVKTECTLQLILKLRGDVGPGLKFADVYYEDTWLVELQLDSKAPDWRTCAEGLNLEGECENDDCEAFGNMVIHQFGFDSFNLMRDHRVPCPNCEKDFKPVTCGFHRCVWKFDGKLSDDGGEMPVARSTIASIRIRLEWDSLLIVAKSRRVAIAAKIPACSRSVAVRKSTVCSICWSTFGSTERNAVSRAQ
ncbi:hypothetical protein PHYSODRAFT_299596 [Phytophthora sojae]|uniref:Ubiquitin-like domain-containing protein n=1 Tax=Phytophthora sojae (strain P6497) TaxID=1094619 RepID=G4Z2R5_PHYSP|nr:hypothetical protein PHYSODRAFT_299596 [Phytophthora sojae]EGZ22190.1 hypothetical protein PHYSODRAFT_299596 [Phytophthora sojae]|eukprot:XP_009524907.1 hypothetical protein PHYSODRAFT_299596 [Phytophthora sojae]